MSTSSNASGVASPIGERLAPDLDRAARGSLGREQPQLREREALLDEDLGHRPAHGAGGADDGDGRACGEGSQAWSDLLRRGCRARAGVYQRAPAAPGRRWSRPTLTRVSGGEQRRPGSLGELAAHVQRDVDEGPRRRRPVAVPVPHERDPPRLEVGRDDGDQRVRRVDREQRHERAAEPGAGHRLDGAVVLAAEHEVRLAARPAGSGSRPTSCSGTTGSRSAAAR